MIGDHRKLDLGIRPDYGKVDKMLFNLMLLQEIHPETNLEYRPP